MKYHVLHYTLCGGWTNTWSLDDQPHVFDTFEDAQAELDEFFADIAHEIACGDRDPDNTYSRDEFRIEPINESN